MIEGKWDLVAQLYLTLCHPMDCSPPGSPVLGILQARIMEWVAIPFSRGPSQPRDWTQVSCIADRFFTIWATRETQMKKEQVYFPHLWNKLEVPLTTQVQLLLSSCICLFCPIFFQWLLLWESGKKDRLVCLLSYLTLNKLLILNPHVAVICSVIWGQEHLPQS